MKNIKADSIISSISQGGNLELHKLQPEMELTDDIWDSERIKKSKKVTLSSKNIEKYWKNLVELTELTEIRIYDAKLDNLPKELFYFTKIKSLNIDSTAITKLPEEILLLTDLQVLKWGTLEYYNGYKKIFEIPGYLYKLKSLKHLEIAGLYINSLSDEISNLENLEILNIRSNNLTKLPATFCKLFNLRVLSLNNNKITELPKDFGNLSNLRELNLTDNKLTSLPESIGNCRDLPTLDLSKNDLITLPNSIGELINLKFLDISWNKVEYLPNSIGKLVNLKALFANQNNIEYLPNTIVNLYSLEDLVISRNLLKELPVNISKLLNIVKIKAGYNQLRELPEDIGGLVLLETFSVHKNQLTKLPASFIKLRSLKNFGRGNNPFTEMPELQSIKGFMDISRYLIEYYKIDDSAFVVNLEKEWLIPIQQYLMFFREYIEKTEGKEIDYQVRIISNGLEIKISDADNLASKDVGVKILEYVNLLRTNLDEWIVTDNTGKLTPFEADILTEELKENQEAFWHRMKLQKSKLEGEIRKIRMQLREERVDKAALKDELSYKEQRLSDLEHQINDKNDTIKLLENQIEKAHLQIGRKDNQIDSLIGKVGNNLNFHGNNYLGHINLAEYIGKIEFTPSFSKERFTEFTEILMLSEIQTKEIQQIYKDADTNGLDETRVLQSLKSLEQNLAQIKIYLPVPVVKQLDEVKKLQTGMNIEGKFKTSIPIIPFILSYEMEAKSNLKDVFKQIWKDMKNGEIFLKKKI